MRLLRDQAASRADPTDRFGRPQQSSLYVGTIDQSSIDCGPRQVSDMYLLDL